MNPGRCRLADHIVAFTAHPALQVRPAVSSGILFGLLLRLLVELDFPALPRLFNRLLPARSRQGHEITWGDYDFRDKRSILERPEPQAAHVAIRAILTSR